MKVIVPYLEAQLRRRHRGSASATTSASPPVCMRTMTADLTGKLPPGTRRIRIWTNLKIYWDQVLIDTTPEASIPFTRTEVPLVRASLAFRGYPREILGTPAADIRYDFNDVSQSRALRAASRLLHEATATCTPLVRAAEDHFVIFGSGDDVAIDFDAATLPPASARLDARLRDLSRWLREGHGLLGRASRRR